METNKGGGEEGWRGWIEPLPGVSEGEEDGSKSETPQRNSTGGQLFVFGEKERKTSSPPLTVTW